ncbi:MAG: T9SS type A sorting domain-containing protein, partial [Bacteroidia bacterium]|nr:T9SS type A sorting domain-containing protein [Bacteroidia bacterium]MDW8134700.1 T9SS type A sorting domain-containing protein [Bacteroidia bacterium]
KGDFLEIHFYWRGSPQETPLGANFVLTIQPSQALSWDQVEVIQRGKWDKASSPLYLPLYITQRAEVENKQRTSLNLLASIPPAGIPFQGIREKIGAWRVPIQQFGDTAFLRWSMETGEIVLAPFNRSRERFIYIPPHPVWLCPKIPPASLEVQGESLAVALPADFRTENLTVYWYKESTFVGEGLKIKPLLSGSYVAHIRHRCGSEATTDTMRWRTTGISIVQRGGWKIYPQPSTGTIWIEAPYPGEVKVRVQDALGRSLYQTTFWADPSKSHFLSLPSLPSGTYQLIISHERESQILPLIHVQGH